MTATYAEPETVDQAVGLLAELGGDAGIVAGGTDLVVRARGGAGPLPEALVAIHRLGELRSVGDEGDRLRIGALVTYGEIEGSSLLRDEYAALTDAAALVGSPATRHVATLGGNLCNGSPAMEAGSPLLVFGASVELASTRGKRTLEVEEFLRGPGETALESDELLTGITIPTLPPGSGSAYVRLEYRRSMEIAVVGAAALLTLDAGRVAKARVALTAVSPTCIRAPGVEAALEGEEASPELLGRAARAAEETARPIDDVRAPADYRRAMVPVIVGRALNTALERAGKVSP